MCQLSVDLGSSQYLLAVKIYSSEIITINLIGNQQNNKIDSTACVSLQKCINQGSIESQYISFGQVDHQKNSENTAIFQNWKNHFYESEVKIEYPFSPSIPSSGDKSAQIWVSSLFEAFLIQSFYGYFKQIIQNNDQQIIHLITFLVPSLINIQHKQFLNCCFSNSLRQFINSTISKDEKNDFLPVLQKTHTFFFQLKEEAIASFNTAVLKIYGTDNKLQEQNKHFVFLKDQTFLVADLGGFTSDFALADFESQTNTYNIQCSALNVAGNTIDQVRKSMIINQFGDLQITNQYNLSQLIMQLKQENLTEFDMKQCSKFMNPLQLCVYVVQIIVDGIVKIQNLCQCNANEEKICSLFQIIIPFIFDNMQTEFIKQFDHTHFNHENISGISVNKEKTLQTASKPEILLWIFKNFETTAIKAIIQFVIDNSIEMNERVDFLQNKNRIQSVILNEIKQLQFRTKTIQSKSVNQILIILKKLIDILPHISIMTQFKQLIDDEISKIDEAFKSSVKNVINEIMQKSFDESALNQQNTDDDFQSNFNLLHYVFGLKNFDYDTIKTNMSIQKDISIKISLQQILFQLFLNDQYDIELQRFAEYVYGYLDCKYLKQTIENLAIQRYGDCHIVKSIKLKENIRLSLYEQCLQKTKNIVIEKIKLSIQKSFPDITNIVYSGGFAQCTEFDSILKISPQQLVIGGIEYDQQENILNSTFNSQETTPQIQKYQFSFDDTLEISQAQNNEFSCNKLNIDIGTNGTQSYFVWSKQNYLTVLNNNQYILQDLDKKRLNETITPEKMLSFAIINYTKLEQYLNERSQRYFENGIVTQQIENVFLQEQFTPTQIMECISFESVSKNKYKEQKVGKLKKKQQQSTFNIDIITSWKRKLFDIERPNFPDYPVCELPYYSNNSFKLKIPLSLIYQSMLQFLKSKYQLLHQDASKLNGQLTVSLTVPCGANKHHLHYLRCCCKAAGFGDNISFIFEPVSAFTQILYSNIYATLIHNKEANTLYADFNEFTNQYVLEQVGNYVVIDVGAGTTDVAVIEISAIENNNNVQPNISLLHFFSVYEAGDYIDASFFQHINFEKIKQQLSLEQILVIASQLTASKNNKDECSTFEIILDENQINPISQLISELKNIKNAQIIVENKLPTLHKLQFSINNKELAEILQLSSKQILLKINTFLQQLNITLQHSESDKKKLQVLCVGGVGGSPIFQNEVSQILQCEPDQVQKVDLMTAQSSIAKGGLFLISEKDYVNFSVQQTKSYEENLEIDCFDGLQLKFEVMDKQFTHIIEKQVFVKEQRLTEKRFFQCVSGWNGVNVSIYSCKNQNDEKLIGNINFSVEHLNSLESLEQCSNQDQSQYVYIGCMFVQYSKTNGSITITCKLAKNKEIENQYEKQTIIESSLIISEQDLLK